MAQSIKERMELHTAQREKKLTAPRATKLSKKEKKKQKESKKLAKLKKVDADKVKHQFDLCKWQFNQQMTFLCIEFRMPTKVR